MYITENQSVGDSVLFLLAARTALSNIVESSKNKNADVINFIHNEASDYQIMNLLLHGTLPKEKYDVVGEAMLFSDLKESMLQNYNYVTEMVGEDIFFNVLHEVDSLYMETSTSAPILEVTSNSDDDVAGAFALYSLSEGPIKTAWNTAKVNAQVKADQLKAAAAKKVAAAKAKVAAAKGSVAQGIAKKKADVAQGIAKRKTALVRRGELNRGKVLAKSDPAKLKSAAQSSSQTKNMATAAKKAELSKAAASTGQAKNVAAAAKKAELAKAAAPGQKVAAAAKQKAALAKAAAPAQKAAAAAKTKAGLASAAQSSSQAKNMAAAANKAELMKASKGAKAMGAAQHAKATKVTQAAHAAQQKQAGAKLAQAVKSTTAKTSAAKSGLAGKVAAGKAALGKGAAAAGKFATSKAGLATGGAAGAALAIYAGYKIYKRFLSQAAKSCAGQSGAAKTACMNKYKKTALMKQASAIQSASSKCAQSKDPAKCKAAIAAKISSIKAKAAKIA